MKETFPPVIGAPKRGKLGNPLPSVTLTALSAIQTTRIWPEGYEFFLEGQQPLGIYVLYTGRVQLSVTDAHGRQMLLGTAQPGDILGLSAVVSGKYYEETAIAAISSQAGFIKCHQFRHFLDHHPEAAFWVVQLLSDRVTTTLDQLSCFRQLLPGALRQ